LDRTSPHSSLVDKISQQRKYKIKVVVLTVPCVEKRKDIGKIVESSLHKYFMSSQLAVGPDNWKWADNLDNMDNETNRSHNSLCEQNRPHNWTGVSKLYFITFIGSDRQTQQQ